jgi:hypothetical protein
MDRANARCSVDKGVVDFEVATDQPRTKIPGAPD